MWSQLAVCWQSCQPWRCWMKLASICYTLGTTWFHLSWSWNNGSNGDSDYDSWASSGHHLSKSEDIVADRPGKAQSSNGLQVAGCVRMHLDQYSRAFVDLSSITKHYDHMISLFSSIYQCIYVDALKNINKFFPWGFLVFSTLNLEVLEVLIQPGVQVNEAGVDPNTPDRSAISITSARECHCFAWKQRVKCYKKQRRWCQDRSEAQRAKLMAGSLWTLFGSGKFGLPKS